MNERAREHSTATRIVILALVLATLYSAMVWLQSGQTLSEGTAVERGVNRVTVDLNANVAQLTGETAKVTSVAQGLTDAEEGLATVTRSAESLYYPLLPGGAGARRAYSQAILRYIDEAGLYVADLRSVADKITRRAVVVDNLSKGFGGLAALSSPDLSTEQASEILAGVQVVVDDALAETESLETTGVSAYSSDAFIARLQSLSSQLATMRSSLDTQDVAAFADSTTRFTELMNADWQQLFFIANEAGVRQLSDRVGTFDALKQEVTEARALVASVQDSYGFAALVLATITLLAFAASLK